MFEVPAPVYLQLRSWCRDLQLYVACAGTDLCLRPVDVKKESDRQFTLRFKWILLLSD